MKDKREETGKTKPTFPFFSFAARHLSLATTLNSHYLHQAPSSSTAGRGAFGISVMPRAARATVSTITFCAPAFFNSRAQAEAVAPVVITSSMSSTILFLKRSLPSA